MNRTQLQQAGRLIWGERYVAPMARHFKVHITTGQRWDDGRSPIPDYVEGRLRALLVQRRDQIEKMMTRLSPVS